MDFLGRFVFSSKLLPLNKNLINNNLVLLLYHPPGPVLSLVLTPLLKSGIPVEVLMPAPVNAIKCLDYFTRLASSVTFLSNSSSESKYSFFSSSDWIL